MRVAISAVCLVLLSGPTFAGDVLSGRAISVASTAGNCTMVGNVLRCDGGLAATKMGNVWRLEDGRAVTTAGNVPSVGEVSPSNRPDDTMRTDGAICRTIGTTEFCAQPPQRP